MSGRWAVGPGLCVLAAVVMVLVWFVWGVCKVP
jgi:hypothetical protein